MKNRKTNGFGRRIKRLLRKIFSALKKCIAAGIFLILAVGGTDYYTNGNLDKTIQFFTGATEKIEEIEGYLSVYPIPEYEGSPYVFINNNIPEFDKSEYGYQPFEFYSELDELGRCRMAEAMLSRELMPVEPRGEIGMVKPTGWHTVKYEAIEDRYLYNRCHLIAFELTGENDNNRNLITGTRYMNISGMLPWENRVAQYIRRTNDKVLYRVTPVFQGRDLVARGVHMEAQSVSSDEIRFNIFVFNVQPGIKINYSDGSSQEE